MTKRYLYISRIIASLTLLLVMGVGNAWADKWDGTTVATTFANGSGTEADPYIINSAAELAYFGSQMNGKSWYVKLGVDIDLNNHEWTYGKNSATNFKGHFDGNGKTIKKFKLTPVSAKNNGFFSSLQGTATSRAEVKCLVFDSVSIAQTTDLAATTITGTLAGNVTEYTDIDSVIVRNTSISLKNLTQANYIGALAGRMEQNQSTFTRCSVVKPVINITGEMKTGASFIGGAIGQVSGSASLASTIDNLTVDSASITINKVNIKDCFIGAVFGRVNTYSTISNVTVNKASLTYKNTDAPNVALNLGTFAGGILGIAAMETAVTNIKMTGYSQMTIGNSNDVKAVKAGIVGQATTNVRLENWTIDSTIVSIKGNLATAASNIGGFIGYTASAASAPVTIKDITIKKSNLVSISGNLALASQIGGFVGYTTTVAGAAVKFLNTKIEGTNTVAIGGNVTTASQVGGFVGYMIPANSVNNQLIFSTAGVDSTTTVSVAGTVSGASHYGGFVGQISGRALENNEVKLEHISMDSISLSITGTVSASSYFGGLIGLATTNATLSDITVTKAANVTLSGDITKASYIGGVVGDLTAGAAAYLSSIDGLNVTKPNVTVNKNSVANTYIGAVFGRVNTYSTISNVTVNKASLTYTNNGAPNVALNLGTFAGGIFGVAAMETAVTNVNMTGYSQMTIGNSNDVKAVKAGIVGQATTNVRLENWTVDSTIVSIKGNLATTASNIGGFIGYTASAASAPVTIKDITIKKSNLVSISGNLALASQIGGFVGYTTTVAGAAVKFLNTKIEGTNTVAIGGNVTTASQVGGFVGYMISANSVNNQLIFSTAGVDSTTTVSVAGTVSGASHYGGFVGQISGRAQENNEVKLEHISMDSISLSITGAVSAASYFGGLIGLATTNATLSDITVTKAANVTLSGEIKTASSFVGGVIGQFAGAANYVSTINGLNVTKPTLTINKISYKDCYVGAVFGRVNTYSTVKNVTVSSPTLTYTNTDAPSVALNLGTFAGGIFGVAGTKTAVTDVNLTGNAQLTIGNNNNVSAIKAGIIGQATTNASLENWTVDSTTVLVKGNLATAASNIGGFIGYTVNANNAPMLFKNITITGKDSVAISGNVDIASQIGGFVGYATTVAGAPVTFQKTKITGKSTVSVGGNVTTASQLGGFAGMLATGEKVSNTLLQVDTAGVMGGATVAIAGDVTGASHYGGFAGEILGRSIETNIVQVDSVMMGATQITIGGASSAASYYGGLVGYITQGCTFDKWVLSSSDVTINGNVSASPFIGSAIGGILAAASFPTSVTNVTIGNAKVTTGTTTANSLVGAKVGMIGQASTNVTLDTWKLTGNDTITINGAIKTTAGYVGGFIGNVVSAANAPAIIRNITATGTSHVKVTGDISIASYVGGVIGDVTGVLTQATVFDRMNFASPSVSIYNCSVASCYIGSVFSRIQKYNEADHITVSNPTLTYDNVSNSNVSLFLGTFAGYIGGEAATKETPVTNVTINGTSQLTIGTETNKATTEAKNIKAGLVGQAEKNVRLEDWTIANSNVQVYGKLTTTGSQIGAFAGNLTGAANAPVIASAKITGSSSLTVTGDVTVASYLGGYIGQATTNVSLENCEVSHPTVTLKGGLKTATSYVGGAFGYFLGVAGNTSFIDGLTVTDPQVSVVSIADKEQYIGSVFGRINTYSNINDVTVSNPQLTYNAVGSPNIALYLGTFAGYLTGVKEQENPITNVNVTGTANLTIGTDAAKATTNISNVRAGLLGIVTTNVRLENWSVANTGVQVYGNLTTSSDYIGGFAGHMESGSNTPLTLKNDYITGNSTVNVTGNIIKKSYLGGFAGDIVSSDAITSYVNIDDAGIKGTSTVSVGGDITTDNSYVGGFTGYMQGRNKASNYFHADNIYMGTAALTITGQVAKTSYFGGIVGWASTSCAFSDWKITTASKLTFNGNITDLSYVGGAIGSLEGASGYPATVTGFDLSGIDITLNCNLTKGIYAGGLVGQMTAIATTPNKIEKSSVSGKIHASGSHTYTNGDIAYAFGGIVGYLPQSSSTFSEVNNCISEVDFDLSTLTPATAGNMYSGLVVGGVVGRINTPSRLPEALYYSGKVYAPTAAVGPAVGVFVTKVADNKYIYDDYTGVNATAISADEWGKADDWYYNGYQIGLSAAVTGQTLNTTESPVGGYLTIGEETLTNANPNSTATTISKTILYYAATSNITPVWTKNNNTYPDYYMYYMQGVNRGKFAIDSRIENLKDSILTGKLTLLALIDENADFTLAANRGFISHALTATASSADSYKWYVDGNEQTETSANFAVTPALAGNTIAVEAIKNGKALKKVDVTIKPVFRVNDASAETYGTKTNPYLIGSADELQLLSYLSTLPLNTVWEKTYTSDNHYNKAYYELDNDIDLSGIVDFTPISFATGFKANNGMSMGYIFDGVFDGKQHTISGLKEGWYGGAINANDSYLGWGLFSIVGSPMSTVKVGDSGASPAVIRNLIIDGATLTHQTSNATFNYNNNTADVKTSNNVCIGVLAGIVQNNTTIENIEIRGSKITDAGSSDYSLATRGLYVGGAVGSIQNAFNEVTAPVDTKLQHIAAQVDITLEHPTFADASKPEQLGAFNIGGIIGRYCATTALQAQAQASMPAYTLYSGSVNAQKAWISPVLGALRYTSQQSISFANYSKIWEGNNNSDVTQITITNAQYYNFRINGELITELYPVDACSMWARPISIHTNATEALGTYSATKYQGVNYSARFIDSEGTTLRYLCEGVTDGVFWIWNDGFPHLTDQPYKGAYLESAGQISFTAQMENGTANAYQWQISSDGENWVNIPDISTQSCTPSSSANRRLIVAIITTDGGVKYRTQAEIVMPTMNLYAPYIEQSGNDSEGYTFIVNWNDNEPDATKTVTYQWYHNDKTTPFSGETASSFALTKSELDEEDGLVWCEIIVEDLGTLIYKGMHRAGRIVVFVDGTNGVDNAAGSRVRGWTPETAVKTIDNANLLLDGGTWDNNIVVVIGTLNADGDFRSTGKNPATLTGFWDGTDYKGIIKLKQINQSGGENALNPARRPGFKGSNCHVLADTKFEYLTFEANSNTAGNNFIECHGNNVWFGKGLVMTNFRNLSKNHGNLDAAQNIPELTIVLTATNLNEEDIRAYTNRVKPQTLTIESGRYGRIMGGRYTNGFFGSVDNTSHTILGSAEHPVWAIVNIDIDKDNPNKGTINREEEPNKGTVTDNYTLDVNCIVAGLTDGTMYGDYEINVHGGKIGYIVGGNQGNPVPNGAKTFTQPEGESGNWGQWPNSSYFGRTVINVEQDPNLKDITIDNLYAGGLGREANGDAATSIVDMYMYGHTEINMKSGTVTGNVYGGGAGGVIGINPWDMHIPYATTEKENVPNAIMNGVQYGEWGAKKAGSPLVNVTLHDSDGNGGYITKLLYLGESSTTLNISGGTINGSVYGGGCGYVSNMPKEVVMQGVGSVFGTSNVNISGGTIHGSVYGGSEGSNKYYNSVNKYFQTINHIAEMNGTVNMTITCDDPLSPPTIDGSIYGAGKGIESSATEEYLRIATAGNTDLGDEYKTNINITINMPESIEFPNDIYGGGALGKVDGNTNIILKRGLFTGSIYGGGYGEKAHLDKAMVTGTTNIYTGAVDTAEVNRSLPVTIEPIDTKIPTIYGGGNMAQVTGNTYINIWHGNITADIFGGGKGLTQAESGTFSGYGRINGNTRVLYNNSTENNILTGNIYGGGALGAVIGTGDGDDKGTTVVIKAGDVNGDVFGGGKGEEGSEKAKVTGNTHVIVDEDWEPTPEPTPDPEP